MYNLVLWNDFLIKKSKEIHSIVQKRHKTKTKESNGDYFKLTLNNEFNNKPTQKSKIKRSEKGVKFTKKLADIT